MYFIRDDDGFLTLINYDVKIAENIYPVITFEDGTLCDLEKVKLEALRDQNVPNNCTLYLVTY